MVSIFGCEIVTLLLQDPDPDPDPDPALEQSIYHFDHLNVTLLVVARKKEKR
jgi:hypothetical protein